MPTLTDLALRQAGLAEADVDWLHMLLADWQLPADPAFADRVARLVAAGLPPRPGEQPRLVRSPRVGAGLLRLGRSGRVTYASPNGLSAYRRLGLTADLVGAELGPLTAWLCATRGPRDDSLMLTASGRAHMETEVEGNGSVVQPPAIPPVAR